MHMDVPHSSAAAVICVPLRVSPLQSPLSQGLFPAGTGAHLIDHVERDTWREHHVMAEAEIGVMQLQVKKCQGLWSPSEARKMQKIVLLRLSEGI